MDTLEEIDVDLRKKERKRKHKHRIGLWELTDISMNNILPGVSSLIPGLKAVDTICDYSKYLLS